MFAWRRGTRQALEVIDDRKAPWASKGAPVLQTGYGAILSWFKDI
jgi:hypothetical protein